jgi:hypothetical protein
MNRYVCFFELSFSHLSVCSPATPVADRFKMKEIASLRVVDSPGLRGPSPKVSRGDLYFFGSISSHFQLQQVSDHSTATPLSAGCKAEVIAAQAAVNVLLLYTTASVHHRDRGEACQSKSANGLQLQSSSNTSN